MNAACAWTNDPPRALDLRRAADRRHLDRDAETAEELAIRYADAARGHRSGHFAGDAEYAGARERCMATLVDAAAAAHGVDRRDVVDAIGRRPTGVDLAVPLSFACAY